MKKAFFMLLSAVMLCLALCSCGRVKTADELVKTAKSRHGSCTLVSRSESEEKSTVKVKDKLQGFEYELSSCMQDINIDGSSFGSVPGTTDTFEMELMNFVLESAKADLDSLCGNYRAEYVTGYGDTIIELQLPSSASEKDAESIAEKAADILQKYNRQHRMDGFEITVSHDAAWLEQYYDKLRNSGENDGYIFSSAGGAEACHIGSVLLPDCRFRDKEKEHTDYYTEMAQSRNRDAEFVRKEKKPFSDTGISPDRVDNPHWTLEPPIEKMTDEVTFYYFRADGKEFYICDFLDNQTGSWHTNYDEMNIQQPKKKRFSFRFTFS